MKIAFVCTNYNNTKFTREAVRSLLLNQNHDLQIVIVDNKSNPHLISTQCYKNKRALITTGCLSHVGVFEAKLGKIDV